ncbi:hypothetical protein ANSO36C_30670 [Nostoc cf. commune SO-36]|uniref:Uncharacterized protein n=1 Tax=Nostoc cf. commune SO-36 TaxID=449208 RepID=A0ABM7Z2P7_NOSCO|nr:hypothetical protein [Nostoc commune]BDI17265.1 hypothetical protein ANSO36C_30670 [Nostoc cf. commune SO-36]
MIKLHLTPLPMNEQRQQAYLNLIQRLLNCRTNNELQETLAANQELVDIGFLQTIEAEAQRFSQQGDETSSELVAKFGNATRGSVESR